MIDFQLIKWVFFFRGVYLLYQNAAQLIDNQLSLFQKVNPLPFYRWGGQNGAKAIPFAPRNLPASLAEGLSHSKKKSRLSLGFGRACHGIVYNGQAPEASRGLH